MDTDAHSGRVGLAPPQSAATIGGASPTLRSLHLLPIFSFLISILFSLWIAWASGRNLGLFVGGLAVAALLAPVLSVSETSWRARAMILLGIIAGISIIWLGCIFNDSITWWEWCRCVIVLIVFAAAVAGIAALLVRIRVSLPAAAAIVAVMAIAWLSWPIWMAPWLTGEDAEKTAGWLVAANPAFAVQGALKHAFPVPWLQEAIAYSLTNLGDDIPYQMPTSILRCVIAHGMIAIIVWTAAHWPARPAHPPADR
jgi:hypothetical protein